MSAFRIEGLLVLTGILVAGPSFAALKMKMVRGHPVVDGVYVNGHGPYRFLIDTGTTLNHLDPAVAQKVGLKTTLRTELNTSTGVTIASGASGVSVSIGSVRAEDQSFLFAGLDAVHQRFPDVQGVLGQSFLSQFDYQFDLRGKQIEFGKQEPEPTKTRVPFQTVIGRPVIATSLGSLVLDSGASWLTLFGVASKTVTREVVTMTGTLQVGMVSRRLAIAGHTFWRGSAVAIPEAAEPGATGLLPINLFKAVYVCNSGRYLVFD
jgi:hypothetical protein